MAEKTLKIKRVFAQAIFNNLNGIPPKDYPTTAEIKSTVTEILPALKEHLAEYVKIFSEAREVSDQHAEKKITGEEFQKQVDGFNERLVAYSKTEGQETVEIGLTTEGMKTLSDQFNRDDWGKKWFQNIEEFSEVMTAFDEAGK